MPAALKEMLKPILAPKGLAGESRSPFRNSQCLVIIDSEFFSWIENCLARLEGSQLFKQLVDPDLSAGSRSGRGGSSCRSMSHIFSSWATIAQVPRELEQERDVGLQGPSPETIVGGAGEFTEILIEIPGEVGSNRRRSALAALIFERDVFSNQSNLGKVVIGDWLIGNSEKLLESDIMDMRHFHLRNLTYLDVHCDGPFHELATKIFETKLCNLI